MKTKTLTALALLLLTTGCQQFMAPVPYGMYRGMRDGAPEGSDTFRDGFKAGCTSGMAAYGPYHYKVMYDYTYDANMVQNAEYHNAWRIGFRHCRWYTQEWTKPWN